MAGLIAFWAQGAMACRLALILAIDVSSSVDAQEDALQRNGLARALVAPDVQAAMFATDDPVALAVFEWSGRYQQQVLQDWIIVDTPATLSGVADRIANSTRSYDTYPTALGYALGYASSMMRRAPECDQQKIDVSGDGLNNDGFSPRDAFGAFDFNDITVNGLVISVPDTDDVLDYYASHVIRGPAAFVEIANGFDDFSRAMERKLIRELGVLILGQNG